MSVLGGNPLLIAGDDGYQISRSVRLRSSASAYLSRAYGSSGNTTTFTYSAWLKLPMYGNNAGGNQYANLLCAGNGTQTNSTNDELGINSSGQITFLPRSGVGGYGRTWTPNYRDPSAWYHIVLVVDLGNATNDLKAILYVNGQKITAYSGTSFLGSLEYLNRGYTHYIGRTDWGGGPNYTDQYMAEVNFIDGQALTASSFGETDAITGVWKPKKYAGTYGTNGFYLNFSDNSAATAAAIGKDSSGNGNNWTPNNISLTAGATYDSMIDTPTPYADGGTGRGNYCVLNPLLASASLSAGNLDFTQTNTKTAATFGVTSGKWYAEAKVNTVANQLFILGVAKVGDGSSYNMFASGVGYYANDGTKYVDGANTSYGATYTAGDTIGIALDMDGGTVTFYKNNTSQGSITLPSSAQGYFPLAIQASSGSTSATWSANFGQRPFTYTPPTGYKALNTQNLPVPTITNGAQYMSATVYAGSASTQVINSNMTALDFAWIKNRTTARSHALVDTVRGGSPMLTLYSDLTLAEDNTSPNYNPTSISGSSITLGGAKLGINNSGENFVMWGWRAGAGTTSSNTSGSITSTVSVNATAGFSIVTYSSSSTVASTVGHGLGVAPAMMIVKCRNVLHNWFIYHKSLGATNYLLFTTAASAASISEWNNTAPTSTVFSVGTDLATSGENYVAYCWAEVAGFSKFGSYTGNGSTDGPFVFLGFRPRWLMIKRSSTASVTYGWQMYDTSRQPYNTASSDPNLWADTSAAEGTGNYTFDLLSNGFKLRSSGVNENASSDTYIYAAFAENPFKNALAR